MNGGRKNAFSRLLKYRALPVILVLLSCLFYCANPAQALSDVYSLHVGTFTDPVDANRELNRLKTRGLEAFSIADSSAERGTVYRVYVGMLNNWQEAGEYAVRLKKEGVIQYYQIDKLEKPKVTAPEPKTVPAGPAAPTAQYDTPFKKIVYGRYVASFKFRHLAEAEAEGLTQYGWPASVVEERVQGTMWYRVYLLPPQGNDYSASGRPGNNEVPGFDVIADMSNTGPPPPEKADGEKYKSRCAGYTRAGAKLAILRKFNAAVPAGAYLAGLRELGDAGKGVFAEAAELVQRNNRGAEHTRLLWGVMAYDRGEYGLAIEKLTPRTELSPLAEAMDASDEEFTVIPGWKSLVIVSDFKMSFSHADPIESAVNLKKKYGEDFCIYTVYVDADEKGIQLARDIAAAGGCGNVYDGCLLLTDDIYFKGMIAEVFRLGRRGPCPDADGDGVCDMNDKCPNTPKGALVDERGCWIAAIGTFFDFDKDTVKKQFLPGLEWAADIMKENPTMIVELAGHTDNKGTDAYNMDLGLRRAAAVKRWLVHFGVASNRIGVKSYGERSPAASNSTDRGRAKNRRVEIHVIKK